MRNSHKYVAKRQNGLILSGVLLMVAAALAVPIYSVRSSSRAPQKSAPVTSSQIPRAKQKQLSRSALFAPSILNTMLPAGETITTYAANCTTPKSSFNLGETVCAKITGADQPVDGVAQTKTGWVSPYGSLVQGGGIDADPKTATYAIPATGTQTFTDAGGGTVTVDNRGTWTIGVYSALDGSLKAETPFVVHDPTTPYVDLYASQATDIDESGVPAGSSSAFHIFVGNLGPDAAQNVVLTDNVPANTTFSALIQTSGPTFSCTTPAVGGTGTITCTIASLAADDTASFDLAYTVNGTTPAGTLISNTATMSSDTAELRTDDNSSTKTAKVVAPSTGGGSTLCTVGCPDDIVTDANTTQSGQDGRIVHFSPPSGNDECGLIVVDHCNDCFFAVGVTTVTATSATSDTCSFTVTVNPPNTGNAAIVCPANQTANADSSCEANITIGTPVASGTNVTFYGVRSDGKPLYNCDCYLPNANDPGVECEVTGSCTRRADAPFGAGVTTITWTAYSHSSPGPYATPADEEAARTGSASCVQTITVNDVTPPTISATNSSASADVSCQAPIPDYSNTAADNCACSNTDTTEDCQGHPHFTYTQTPAAGTMVGLGPHTVHITVNDNSSNNGGAGNTTSKDVTFTVNDTTAPVITCPGNQTANTAPGTCSATVVTGTATATDNCDTTPTITATRSDGQPLTAVYPKGTTTITWRATDDAGNYSECTQTVTVVDNEAPTITFNGQTPSMWPPNHSYHTFTAANFVASVSDNCDTLSVSDVDIISATSDETENGGGDGNTNNDIVIASNCKSIQLRAERQGGGNGRVYTITFRLRDTSGNTTTGTAKVYTPKNPSQTPVDDGPHYSVSGNCP